MFIVYVMFNVYIVYSLESKKVNKFTPAFFTLTLLFKMLSKHFLFSFYRIKTLFSKNQINDLEPCTLKSELVLCALVY